MNIETIRSLAFGGLLGAGIFGLIHAVFPGFLAHRVTVNVVLIAGTIAGTAAHKPINDWIVRSVLSPMHLFAGYYSSLLQLVFMQRAIGERRCREIVKELSYKYFFTQVKNTGIKA